MKGVIHDIGYRHYDGTRLGRFPIAMALAAESLRHAYGLGRTGRAKTVPIMLLGIMVVPAAISIGIMTAAELPEPAMDPATYAFYLQPVVALFLASQAPQLFSRDLHFGSLVLYLSRPLRPSDYALAKLAALTGALLVLTGVPLVVLFSGGLLGGQKAGPAARAFGIALAGALILSLLLAAIGALIASITPRRGIAVASIIALLTVSFTAMVTAKGILGGQRSGSTLGARYAELGSPFSLAGGVQVFLLRHVPTGGWMPTAGQGLVFIGVYVAVLGLCLYGLARRYTKAVGR